MKENHMCNSKDVLEPEVVTRSRMARRLTMTIMLVIIVVVDMLVAFWIQLYAHHQSLLVRVLVFHIMGVATLVTIWGLTGIIVEEAQPEPTTPPTA